MMQLEQYLRSHNNAVLKVLAKPLKSATQKQLVETLKRDVVALQAVRQQMCGGGGGGGVDKGSALTLYTVSHAHSM